MADCVSSGAFSRKQLHLDFVEISESHEGSKAIHYLL